jgi:predicted RNA-binding protein YlqC (UPF0109 family)
VSDSESGSDEDVFGTDIDDDEVEDEVGGEGNRNDGATAGGAAGAVLDYVARSIVDDPDAVRIETEHDRRGLTLRLHVAPDDMGKVIGRRGRVAQSIRTLVRAAGAKEGAEVNVDIVD